MELLQNGITNGTTEIMELQKSNNVKVMSNNVKVMSNKCNQDITFSLMKYFEKLIF